MAMTKLKNYIGSAVFHSIALVLLVIVAIEGISEFIDQLDDTRGDYGLVEILIYVGLSLPQTLYEFIPLAALIGVLVGLGVLANSSELIVIRAAGVSVIRIMWAAMRPALVFIGLSLFLGEYITPTSEQYAESRRALAQGHGTAMDKQRGVWNREGNQFMHFNVVLPNGKLFGVTRYTFDEQGKLLQSGFVESAIYQNGYWFEQDTNITRFTDSGTESEHYETRRWDTDLSPELLNVLVLEPEELPLYRLHNYAGYLDKQGLESGDYHLAFWHKALQPLATLSLVMIAISFVLGPLRQVTMGFRVFTGIIIGIIFKMTQDLLGPTSLIFGFSPLYAVLIPIGICFFIGFFSLRRSG